MTNRMHLQFIGDVEGIPADEAEVGMRMMFNYGYTYEILEITVLSRVTLELRLKSLNESDNVLEWIIKKRRTTLIAAYWPKKKAMKV